MVNIILSIIGTLFVVFWLILYFKAGKKYDALIAQVDENEYFAKEFFSIGFCLLEILSLDFNSMTMKKKISKLSQMYGSKIAKQLAITDLAAQLTYTVTILPLGFLFAVIVGEAVFVLIAILLAVILIVYLEYDKNSKLEKRHTVILREFPHVVSQMALLANAGMPVREAIEAVAEKGEGTLYQELRVLVSDMQNGVPDYEAFSCFSERCGVDSVRKFSSLIIQNIRKAGSELAAILMELSGEVWRQRVSLVKEEGEKASAKLLVPILIIFGGNLIMVVVPIFLNMGI